MFLLPMDILGLFTMHCFEGGQPCGYGPGSETEFLDVMKALKCSELNKVTAECDGRVKLLEERFTNAIISLIESGGDVNIVDHWGTPLMRAAFLGFRRAAITLLDNNASPDYVCDYGYTALMMAAKKGHEDIVTALVENGHQ